jgi:ubiquinone/menaquinone biosynthesis C-methylase UbiE
MAFGSVFQIFKYVSLTSVERQSYIPSFTRPTDVQTGFENNFLSKLGFKFLGIPHIGLRLRARKIMKNIPPNVTKMLDAGFGTGVYSFTLANIVKSIDAIDIDTQKINYVREINPFKNISFQRIDLTNLTFDDSRFELIICSDVLEYIEKDDAAFAELARVLKRGGILLMTIPCDSGENNVNYKDYGHVRSGYTEKDVHTLCVKNGLTMVKSKGYSYYFAEKLAKINYSILDKKILLAFLFYLIYGVALISELFPVGSPHGIFFKIIKK